jgi:hypothetical protein
MTGRHLSRWVAVTVLGSAALSCTAQSGQTQSGGKSTESQVLATLRGVAVETGGSRVNGRAANASPLQGLRIRVSRASGDGVVEVRTNSAGQFSFHLPPGLYTVHGCLNSTRRIVLHADANRFVRLRCPTL